MAADDSDALPATASAYSVEIPNYDASSWFGPVLYEVWTSSSSGETIVWHRCNDFKQLDRHLRAQCSQFSGLPEMSTLESIYHDLGKLYDPSAIIESRRELFCELLRAAIAADPTLCDTELRNFLGVSPEGDDSLLTHGQHENLHQFEEDCQNQEVDDEAHDQLSPMLLRRPRTIREVNHDLEGKPIAQDDAHVSLPMCPVALRRAQSSTVDYDSRIESPTRRRTWCEGAGQNSVINGSAKENAPRKIISARRHTLMKILDEEEFLRRTPTADHGFHDNAVVIARDVARLFPGNTLVDSIRLKIADVLRAYARRDTALGYTQGMCFAAAVVCLGTECDNHCEPKKISRSMTVEVDQDNVEALTESQIDFRELMVQLRPLWEPGFPWVHEGTPIIESLLARDDPELSDHFHSRLEIDLDMIIPCAWLSAFAKWLPLATLLDIIPFLGREALAGFVTVTFLVLLSHRDKLMAIRSLDEMLPFLSSLCHEPSPDNLIQMCELAAPRLRAWLSQTPKAMSACNLGDASTHN